MSHNVETMAWTGETPWHGLGTEVSNDLTSLEMLKAAGLDWEVRKVKATAEVNGKKITARGSDMLVRVRPNGESDDLGVVFNNWNPIQNHDAMEVFSGFVKSGDMNMETAGSLVISEKNNWLRMWALAKVNESFEVVKGDEVQAYFLFSNPHVYGFSASVRFTPTRVVCANTLQMAMSGPALGGKDIKINHRKPFAPDEVLAILGASKISLDLYKEQSKKLAGVRFKTDELKEYFERVWPSTGKKDEPSANAKKALEIIHTQPGAGFGEGSWWQAFNTVTFMQDHVASRGSKEATMVNNSLWGKSSDKKNQAMDLALKYAA